MIGTKRKILTVAEELFRRQGYRGTSVKDVTSTAGVTIGSVYHFFPEGKQQLAEEVIRTSGAAYLELWEAIADEAGDVARGVRHFFDGAADVLASTDFVDICPIGSIAREVASTDDVLRRACADVFASWERSFARRLRAAGVGASTARSLATIVVASLEGGFVLARSARDPEPLRVVGRAMEAMVREKVPRRAARPSRSRARTPAAASPPSRG